MVAPGPPGNSRRQNRAAPERVGLKAGPGKWQRILYIAGKYQPERRWRDIEDIDWADVLSIYLTDIGEPNDQFEIEARIDRLNEFWGGKMLSEVNAWACAGYVKRRGRRGGARRDLETFRAAIKHHAKEGFHRGVVRVSLPPRGESRDRWLTRQEAAALIWHC